MIRLKKQQTTLANINEELDIIQLKNVSKSYQRGRISVPVLRNISLIIRKGELVAITGPSGSGKTTLLNIMGALDYSDSGEVLIAGKDLGKLQDKEISYLRREFIGYIFQNFNLLGELSAEKNIEMPLILAGVSKGERKKRVNELLETVKLIHRRHHKPDELSGGEQQRVAIARALANNPQIILADEPTGNLDHETGNKILELLISLTEKENKTLIFVTHDQEQAIKAKRQIILQDGQIVKDFVSEFN
ncbi:MAG: ABC transporter ATP-binding protein [Candidatus Heimdallarchaeaceae archaeon]